MAEEVAELRERPFLRGIAQRLKDLGWLPEDFDLDHIGPAAIKLILAALKAYQMWHGLPAAEPDAEVARHLFLPRFCGHPEKMSLTLDQTARQTPATWSWLGPTVSNVADSLMRQTIQGAFDAWS